MAVLSRDQAAPRESEAKEWTEVFSSRWMLAVILLLAFAAMNTEPVTLRFYFDLAWSPAGDRIVATRGAARELQEAGAVFRGPAAADFIWLPSTGGANADPNSYQYFDRSAFAVVNIASGQQQRFGTSPRNPIYGPGYWNVDLGLFKTIALPRGSQVQLRIEALNALNHPNFGNPGRLATVGSTSFGVITATRFPTGDSGVARQIQLAAKLLF